MKCHCGSNHGYICFEMEGTSYTWFCSRLCRKIWRAARGLHDFFNGRGMICERMLYMRKPKAGWPPHDDCTFVTPASERYPANSSTEPQGRRVTTTAAVTRPFRLPR